MKQKAVTILTVLLCCALLLSACQDTPSVSEPEKTETGTTAPTITLDDIRKAAPADIDVSDTGYDAACYAIYNNYLSSEDGKFYPDSTVSCSDAAKAIGRITGQTPEFTGDPSSLLTRNFLTLLLYDAAKSLGYSLETSITELPYPDADSVGDGIRPIVLWTHDRGFFDKIVGYRLLPGAAVSRLQLAKMLVRLDALDPENILAAEIWSGLPITKTDSKTTLKRDEIQTAINTAAEKYGADGLQVAVIEKGRVTDTFVYGFATLGTDKMTAEHKIRVASITKVALGIAAELLREEGKIALDEDIGKYWGFKIQNPHFPDDPITVRNILNHTSSIANLSVDAPRDYNSLKSKLQSGGFSPNRPGNIEKWSYNNHAFAVLGVTLELVAKETLDDYLGRKLFAPMNIDASFYPGSIKNTDLLATVYKESGSIGLDTTYAKRIKKHTVPGKTGISYSGGLTASAYDIAKLVSLLAADGIYEGVRLLERESTEIIETQTKNTVRGGFYQALPLRYGTELYGREGLYFHTGSSLGVYNCMSYDPDSKDGVVVLTSGANGTKGKYAIYKVCEEINQYIYGVIA